jgi:hypothetical protein
VVAERHRPAGRGPVGDLQLGQDVGYVVAYRFLAEGEPFGDGGVGPPRDDEVEDVISRSPGAAQILGQGHRAGRGGDLPGDARKQPAPQRW